MKQTQAWILENGIMLFTQDPYLIEIYKNHKIFATYYNRKWKIKKAVQYLLPIGLKDEVKKYLVKESRKKKKVK